jgi:hypothetical protein
MTKAVNKNAEPYDVYIGRGSIFGNPYVIGKDGNRDEVIDRYRTWFGFMLGDKRFFNEVCKLKDKRLGCFCSPMKCHGDVIAEWLDKNLI